MDQPKVSIPVTTYNRKEMLAKCLDSLLNQTYKNIEIIIGDNHSEDGTENLCKEYLKKDNRITYIRHDKNLGMTANANNIYSKVTGKYFICISDDDWLDIDYVEKTVDFMEKNPDYSYICPTVKRYDGNYNYVDKHPISNFSQENYYDRIFEFFKRPRGYCAISGLFRSEYLKMLYNKEGVFQNNRWAEDQVYAIKFLTAGKCMMIDNTHYNKIITGNTQNSKTSSNLWQISSSFIKKDYWERLSIVIPESIMNDSFFDSFLSNKNKKILSRDLKKYLLSKSSKQQYFKELKSYIIRHPLFMFRKDFYNKLSYMKGKR